MAGIIQSVFSKGIYTLKAPEAVNKFKSLASHVGLYVGIVVYTAIGAKIFQTIEHPYERDTLETYQALLITKRVLFLSALQNITSDKTDQSFQDLDTALTEYEEICSQASDAGVDIVSKEFSFNWDYIQSVFFSLTILTTIGYGNFAAVTRGGRIFCLLFGIIGIPFMLSVLADVGSILAGALELAWTKNKERLTRLAEKLHIVSKKKEGEEEDEMESVSLEASLLKALGALMLLVLFLAAGALLFTIWEDWTFFDAFYFCFVTMTTIGFGDMTPSISGDAREEKTTYMLVCTVYILVGLAFTSTIIELVRRQYTESWRKMQELRANIQAQLKLADTLKKLSETAEKNNMDIGMSIADDLEQLKNNLNKFKNSKHAAAFGDVDIQTLDWVEDNKKVKAFFIYESSV
ncbi:potassium channel subfamily K member 18 isoform X2 [Eurytemora carolleeae]|uniref:potassium channel subfamily K member 18 isoform X2 n=1 Tax=Eurytemora carolleeae TaxID=1294199 RepID=UPI000C78341C|nr:potassium channel subfamily K member 18 isoform X2 [Eurytemora carolleeae]|eukprot:XP_023345518.1 potassium channel subfamily K member 18-like isoform X2 [Eurytemora affinis]